MTKRRREITEKGRGILFPAMIRADLSFENFPKIVQPGLREYFGARRAMDIMTPRERSDRMRLIRATDTKPELAVRRLVHGMGYRYRLHSDDLPGRPDIVFRKRRKAIFVHGCFWHLHHCPNSRPPKSRLDYWEPKLQRNVERDKTVRQQLRKLGWRTLVVWECELKRIDRLSHRIQGFLEEKAKLAG